MFLSVHQVIQRSQKKSKVDTGRAQKFRNEWIQKHSWLEEKNGKPFCKLCLKSLSNNVCNIARHHQLSDMHIKNFNAVKGQPKFGQTEEAFANVKKTEHDLKNCGAQNFNVHCSTQPSFFIN